VRVRFNTYSHLAMASSGMLLFLALASQGFAQMESGRAFDKEGERPFKINLSAGVFNLKEGHVEETRRAWDETGHPVDYTSYLSSYTFEELGLTGNHPAIGITFEKQWKFITLIMDGSYINASASSVAKMHSTASHVPGNRRGYYLNVNEVNYNGRSYEYMFIPDGQEFDAEMSGGSIALRMLITPFHFRFGEASAFTPWAHLGIYSLFGKYTIDAGEARGTVQYEIPPETYVIGGEGTGDAFAALPDIGFGGEFRFRLGRVRHGDVMLSLQGDFGFLSYNGNTGNLGISDTRNSKDVDLTYHNYELKASIEIPVGDEVDLFCGVTYRAMDVEADLVSTHKDEYEQENIYHEKYDKHATMTASVLTGQIGLTF